MIGDWTNLLAGAAVGFVIGFLSNGAYGSWKERREQGRLRKKFGHLEREYAAFRFRKDTDEIDYTQQTGKSRLTYEGGNVFTLKHEEIRDPNTWQGTVWMETPSFGSLSWRYVRLHGEQPTASHRFGFKRCIAAEALGKDGKTHQYFYLLGEAEFGREALEKVSEADHANNGFHLTRFARM